MTDQELLEALRGDKRQQAFKKVYQNFTSIRKMVISIGGSAEDAKDIFQDALVIFYQMALKPEFKLNSSIKTLLYSISKNLWLKKVRDYKSKFIMAGTIENDYEAEENFEQQTTEELKTITALQVVEALGGPCKLLLQLFYYHNLSMKEIAERLGYSGEHTAKAQKYKCIERGKKMLMEKLRLQNLT
jgi:RNA polymerase sigma factor (sigma-70 family)